VITARPSGTATWIRVAVLGVVAVLLVGASVAGVGPIPAPVDAGHRAATDVEPHRAPTDPMPDHAPHDDGHPSTVPDAAGPSATSARDRSPATSPTTSPTTSTTRSDAAGDDEHDRDVDDQVVPPPVAVRVPAVGIDARVVPTDTDADRTLLVPDPDRVGWFSRWPRVGADGPAVLVGHVDHTDGPAVLHGLDRVRPGDTVEVDRDDGSTVRFVVTALEHHPKDDFPTDAVYGPTDGPELRLITCGGPFLADEGHYRDNVIAFAIPER
jgi:hypothetical protein